MRNAKHLILPLLLAATFVLGACGVVDFGGSEGEVNCEPLSTLSSYRYEAIGITEVREGEDPPLVVAPGGRPFFRFIIQVDGEVQEPDKINAVSREGGSIPSSDPESDKGRTIAIGDEQWVFLGRWVEQHRSPIAVPYVPVDACNAIAPDLSLADQPSTPEDVNGIASRRYQLEVPNEFFGRHVNFQRSSDAARLIETVSVDISVAEDGNYPTRLSVKGTGEYPDGPVLIAEVGYELSDLNASDIEIMPPCSEDC